MRVSPYYGYRGEYRFRASLAPAGTQVESEGNDQLSQADGVSFTLSGNSLGATVGGYLAGYDTSGDWYGLGNLASGTQVGVTVRLPSTSGLVPTLALFKADGTQMAPDEVTATRLVYTLKAGDESTYYVRVGGSSGLGLMAEYFADIAISDTVPPTITACTLPNPSGEALVTSFSLSFNKDMLATTVTNASNYTLVWAGPDGSFSTADDSVIPVIPANYTSGLSNNYTISNGPLRPGNYVFTATSGLRDKTGNNLPLPFQRAFTITGPSGFATETEPNNSGTSAGLLVFDTSIPGYLTANARGVLSSSEDIEYWTFPAEAGDVMAFEVAMPFEPDSYMLNWYLTDPDGQVVFERNLASNSLESNNPITLAKTGDYRLRIDDYHGIRTEHRFRVSLMRGMQSESEQNDSLGTADPVTFAQVGGISTASIAGFISTNAELDYFDLGQISSGNTVFLTARHPAGSTLGPIVAIYSQAGTLMAETNGVAGDGSAEIQIPTTGRYYALIRGSLGTTGLNGDYILDARVLPTSAINFPNLRVTRLDDITTPGLKTGDSINLSYTVSNVGNLATSASIWVDRVVMSQNAVYGDADDIQLALLTHNGSLAAGAGYSVNQSLALKDGLPGSFYLLVKTDSANNVDEILQEGDNITATSNPFNVILKDYPDLSPEELAISEPDGDGNRTISWNITNKGTGTAAAGHTTRLQVLNTTNSQLVQDVTIPVGSPLAATAAITQSRQINTSAPGYYLVTVSADSGDLLYEFGTGGHASAEQNAVQDNFRIYRLYNVAVSASPAGGGGVTGGGALREGLPATVTATANTSVLPYVFLNWTEDGAFASGQATYTFVPTRDRNLVAVFGLPQFQVAVTVAVPGTGSVSGTGNFPINTPVSLTPNPAAGYLFDHWEEGGSSIGNTSPLSFTATANRNIIAFFRESVPSHVVTTATQPADLAVIPGSGTYTNGQSLTITAPAKVEKNGSEFLFQRIELNGQFLGTSPSFTKTVTTLDAAALQYTAIYQERSLKPKVVGVASSAGTLIPISSGVTFTATFDRDMSTSVVPVFSLLSGNAAAVPAVPAGGVWTDARHFRSSGVGFGATNGGAYTLRITGATDGDGRVMDPDESYGFTVDALVPANPVPAITATGPTSATIGWGSYGAPADLSGFRYYIEETNFTSVAGLSAKGGGNASARSNVFAGLVPDREYFAAVTAVDVAGNSSLAVTPVRIVLQSEVPPPVTPVLTTTGLDSVRLDWSTYDTSTLVGLSRFKVFVQNTPFTTVSGLTPVGDVGASTKTFDVGSLNRTQTYYLAVVAYNGLGQFNPAVAPLSWTDPLAGTLRANLSIGGPTAVIPIHADLILQDGAVLTIAPGTTLRFASGTGIEVLNGKIVANGTDLLPIHFTSDAEGASPARGAWDGITLSSSTGVSELSRVWVRYGGGLRITKGSPLVSNIYAVQNSGAGISVSNDARIDAASCYLAFNENGLTASGSSNVKVRQSVILTNTTSNATQSGTAVLDAASNWWGSSSASTISASLAGTVSAVTPLTGEPVIGSALASASGTTDTGSRDVELRLMAVNAVKYRLSENAAFPGVAFTDLFASDESYRIRPYGFVLPYRLSAGAGLKPVYLQTNSGTSTAGGTLSVNFNYITGGPSIAAFSLSEGQVVSRLLAVTGAATAPLGVKWIDLLVDGVAVARSSSSSFNTLWDPRTLSSGIHRVELRARDLAGNESGRALNVVANPGPPPAPVIVLPVNASVTNVGSATVTGSAEPGISLRITRNGATVSGAVSAAPDGSFSVSGVSLVEGNNKIVVDAFDSLGSASSAPVTVVFDSGPPAAPVLLEPAYLAGSGLRLEWQYAVTGERPSKFKAFWKNAPFNQTSEASGQSDLIEGQTSSVLSSLPDGMWYFSIVGYDDAGNASPLSNQRAITLDFSKPVLTVAYDGALPAGPGNLVITVTSSEALVATPVFSIRPAGSGEVVAVTLIRQSPTQFTANFAVTDLSAKSGTATVIASATDLAGNNFTGSPAGPALSFDVTKPTALVSYDRAAPIQTQTGVTLQLGLQLSEPPAVGSTPTLRFEPPVGADVPIILTGSGLSWTGSLPMTPAMGRGTGFFRLSVTDRSGNVGTVVAPGTLEIYNTALPDPPARPTGLSGRTLAGGRILINWDDVPRAESYKIYREPGNNATVPALLVADNLATSDFTDTPPADGIYTYAIVATLRGADSPASGVLNALSDRTPPPAPQNFAATLGGTGVSVSWSAPSSGETPYSYHVYRGDTSIFTSPTPVTINDNPPRGSHEYRVASVDSHGNENFATPVTIELLVSPVKNMQVLVRDDSATSISWQSDDATVTGYNVYRNGTKQNGAPLTNTFFVDQLPLGTTSVTYEVTARNAAGNESPRRSLTAIAAGINLLLNPDANGVERDSAQFYFDSLRPVVTNVAASGTLRIERFDIIRTAGAADSLETGTTASLSLNPGETGNMDWIVPAPRVQGVPQTIQLLARGPADPSGGRVSYEKSFTKRAAVRSPNIATLQPVSPPLAGGLTDFVATIFNPSSVPIEIIIGRSFGNEPGDVSVRVLDPSGVEVYRKPFKGTGVSPVTVDGAGAAYITIPPSGSRSFTIPQIFVPESLGRAGLSATFILDIAAIRYRLGTGDLTGAGSIGGQTVSSLVETPYYGTAATAKTSYANNEQVRITGQAIDRTTLLPLANKPLRLGFGARGFVTWQDVTTDGSGNYQFDYTPVIGFAGRLNIWAAHPDVVDQLNQVTIDYRRLYVTPGRGDIVMSKNDTLDITLSAVNPGDLPASQVDVSARVFVMDGSNEVEISSIRAALLGSPFDILPNEQRSAAVRLTADLDAPDNALIDLTLLSADGASATFRGSLSLRPAVPALSFSSPKVGYVEGSVNRGSIRSYQVTLQNLGLRPVENPEMFLPANLDWVDVNLPRTSDGRILLQDIPVGGSVTFGVSFAPSDNVPLGLYNGFFEVRASNLQTPFRVNVFPQVTSSLVGDVKFAVDNIFVDPVPNAKVRLRNPNLREELGPFLTDANGEVTVPNLQEGTWSWQVTAAGHSTQTGTIDVVPGQVNLVQTRLSKSLVTVEFSVVPKPFTDRYEIIIEQTFETRVPFPVLVFDPPSFKFTDIPDQFETTLLVKVRNEGLISMFDVQLQGETSSYASLQPLVNYMPELRAQEEVLVPFRLLWNRNGLGSEGTGAVTSSDLGGSISGCADASFKPNILDDDFMAGINAIGKAIAQCTDGMTAALVCSLIVTIDTVDFIMGFVGLEAIAETLGKFLGCVFANYFKDFGIPSGGGGPGNGNGGGFEGRGCFPAGTPVTLSDGTRVPIEQVKKGQKVRSSVWQGHYGEAEDLIIRESETLRRLTFREVRAGREPLGDGDLDLQITGEHLVWADTNGWTAASELKPGDWVHHESGALLEVAANEPIPGRHKVYTLEVNAANAFFASGVMVQDLCGLQKTGDQSAFPKTEISTAPLR
ncbi:hypothetical protein GCM10023212_00010 [Luteolibacter yonseiensis]